MPGKSARDRLTRAMSEGPRRPNGGPGFSKRMDMALSTAAKDFSRGPLSGEGATGGRTRGAGVSLEVTGGTVTVA